MPSVNMYWEEGDQIFSLAAQAYLFAALFFWGTLDAVG